MLMLAAVTFIAAAQNKDNIISSSYTSLTSDSSLKLHVRDIIISGNKKTKTYLIEREIPFKKGDSVNTVLLAKKLQEAKELIYNTTLFNEVKVDVKIISAYDVDVTVDVKERWYIFPVPQFKWVDRNFNDWIKTHNASLKRVNYGVKFIHYNLSGRKDQLKIYLLNGYSRNVSFSYNAPYSNPALTKGFSIAGGFSQSREMAYNTSHNNKILFYPGDSIIKSEGAFVNNNLFFNASYSIRNGFFIRQLFSISYIHAKIADSILFPKYNPNYFNSSKSSIGFPEFSYGLQYRNVNNAAYATKGTASFFILTKKGLGFTGGVNMFSAEAGLNKYHELGNNWYSSVQLSAKIKLPLRQAYINQRGLGYGESYLRGLEYYVIDGVATGLAKTTLKYKILSFKIPLPLKSKSHPYLPVTIFVKTFADAGYAFNKKEFDAYLNNRFLYTGGFGLDILTLYDVNFRIEYSFNQLGEKGLFLHTQGGF